MMTSALFATTMTVGLGGEAMAQEVRPADLVASFESTSVRPLIAQQGAPQAYGGVALGGIARLGEGLALPLGGGVGLTDRFELGVDLGVGIEPFDALERARAYGRFGVVPGRVAVQVGSWLPTEPGEHAGMELMVPVRRVTDRLELYGQTRGSWTPGADALVLGAGGTVAVQVGGPVWTGLDLGVAQRWAEGTTVGLVATGVHTGVLVGEAMLVRARLALPSVTARDETDAWDGLSAKTVELMVVRRFGG